MSSLFALSSILGEDKCANDLWVLNLRKNKLCNIEKIQVLARGIKKCWRLEELDLSYNQMGCEGVKQLSTKLPSALKKLNL